ncbi:MAG TPA: ribonuclease HII [Bryobacteraceae bacterium]|nr:ribonuclease HII [Bryobacteraceae bacterium]
MRCQGKYEREARAQGFERIAGVDEVGRGALFGPVFAAAVVLSPERPIRGLRDSKQLLPERREVLAERIRERAIAWAVGAADAFEIDHINIYQASRLAMRRAIEKLNPLPDYLLVDAITVDLPLAQLALIHGDALSQCIAAASILAKVERDACMREWDKVFPQYGLKNHKGYSTDEHWKALENHGPTSLHRFSFWPVREHSPQALWTGYPVQGELFPPESDPSAWPPDDDQQVQEMAACNQ